MTHRSAHTQMRWFVLAALFVAAGVLPLPSELGPPVWWLAGIGMAAALLEGPQVAPVLVVGFSAVGFWHHLPVAGALGLGLGQTLGAVVGAWLTSQLARGPKAFEHSPHVLLYATIVALASAPLGALFLIGTVSSPNPAGQAVAIWRSTTAAYLLVTPALVLWGMRPRLSLGRRAGERRGSWLGWRAWVRPRALEAWALTTVALGTTTLLVQTAGPQWMTEPILIAPFPLVLWAALRFGARETATVLLLFAVGATWADPGGASGHSMDRLLFLLSVGLTGLTAAATIDQRNRADSKLHQLAITDPLTGLANYRHLTSSIDRHIARSRETGQPFSLILLDVNKLKSINDEFGHNVGSRVLVRLAEALRASCRVTDLIARYGGDEFAVLLPGCDEAAARGQAQRVEDAIAADAGTPELSASLGIAVYPRDGESCDELLDRADDELYSMKARPKARTS